MHHLGKLLLEIVFELKWLPYGSCILNPNKFICSCIAWHFMLMKIHHGNENVHAQQKAVWRQIELIAGEMCRHGIKCAWQFISLWVEILCLWRIGRWLSENSTSQREQLYQICLWAWNWTNLKIPFEWLVFVCVCGWFNGRRVSTFSVECIWICSIPLKPLAYAASVSNESFIAAANKHRNNGFFWCLLFFVSFYCYVSCLI